MKIWKFSNNILYWQYPVITEKQGYISANHLYSDSSDNYIYIAIPWATMLDKRINIQPVIKVIQKKQSQEKNKIYITVCQHISYKHIISLLKQINVSILYASHKTKNLNIINGITIKAFPLYAANIEDESRNSIIKQADLNKPRKYLYSFVGAYMNHYMTKIRQDIFSIKHSSDAYVKNTGIWHFEKEVYQEQVRGRKLTNNDKKQMNNTCDHYNTILLDSRYSLCPSGSGPNTIRFWESLAVGSIPVLLSDTYDLPPINIQDNSGNNITWENTIVFIKEKEYYKIPKILKKITKKKENIMRNNCIQLYTHFSKHNFSKCITN